MNYTWINTKDTIISGLSLEPLILWNLIELQLYL